MGFRLASSSGVSGTVGAFNFIRRVTFPATPEVVSVFCTLVFLSTLIALPSAQLSLPPIIWTTILIVILPVLAAELLNAGVVLRGEPVLNFRRLMGLELLCWWPLLPLLPLSTVLGIALGSQRLWADGLLLSLALSLPIRSLSIFSISPLQPWRKATATALVPVMLISLSYSVPPAFGIPSFETAYSGLGVFIVGLVVSVGGVSWMLQSVERSGSPSIGDSPMGLFRAFLRHWLKKDREPLEERLVRVGSQGQVETSILAFISHREKAKGCIVISDFHPGPYRDLGSGGLPSSLKSTLESSSGGVALVPHGISNHENNIISREDITTLLRTAREHYPTSKLSSKASKFIREEFEGAKASAQRFGNLVLLTLTIAPEDMEDIPIQVLRTVQSAASERGLVALVVDAHNSLSNQTSITPDQARKLTRAAIKALSSVAELQQGPFKVGAAADSLREFRLEDGLGPGGLSIIVIETDSQLACYVTIDGNNLQSGFRDILLGSMKEEGIDEGEVTTTDTHLVTGLVRSPLGYHPVGGGIDKRHLIMKIRDTTRKAAASREEASAGFSTFKLNARVLGSEAFNSITIFIGRVAERIGRFLLRLELATILSALIILALL